ncbi:hypothetical protein EXA21_04665 [Vibrio cincinnatiensis]|uniref:hypothetical protein n=1 Tax=Vibrio cincinnatiensis TaxID=675 RepID=UPI001EDF618F|nr:hypothetical protein [Vibrio cincinnatiensis]MCG3758848.1 hypothetical protein [Vibrio cincinnatiensis]MCG3762198.1 hypothetical protein [Vibrio cincinnatiensis]
MKLSVIKNQELVITLDGQYIYLKSAAGELEFYREASTERFSLSRSAVYRVVKGEIGRLIITPKFTGTVEIITGWGEFTPPTAGQPVVVESQPPVEIAEGQTVALSAPVALAEGQKVALSAPVALAEGQTVALSAPVALAEGQTVALSAPVELAEGQKVEVSGAVSVMRDTATTLTTNADDLPLVVPENAERRVIVIKAPLSNGAAVMINGFYELDAGEKIQLETTASIELTGADGDRVCVLEC